MFVSIHKKLIMSQIMVKLPSEDSRSQAKSCVVGSFKNLLLCVKRQNGHHRAKDLLLHTSHVIPAVICVSL